MGRIGLLLAATVAWTQDPSPRVPSRAYPPQFDAASVKAAPPEHPTPSQIATNPGRLSAQSVSIGALIAYAYDVQPAQIANLRSDLGLYDVEGQADAAYSQAELRGMLQGLLAERFRLRFHREIRAMPVRRLLIGNEVKALQLRATELSEADPRGFALRRSERGPNFLKATADAMSIDWLANNLSGAFSSLVVNGTGLKGVFEFEVDFQYDSTEAADKAVPLRDVSDHIREAMLSALGLKLESGKKALREVLVIDKVERPEAN